MKKITAAALAAIMMMTLISCESKEQKAINEKNIEQAKINAQEYIEEKYGFEAEITDAYVERHAGLFGAEAKSTVIVKMEYKGKAFNVYIDGETENTDGADSYQADEIISGIEELFRENIPEVVKVSVNSGRGTESYDFREREDYENLYSTYYDGENILELLNEGDYSIIAECINADALDTYDYSFLDDIVNSEEMSRVSRLSIVSYKSEEARDKASEKAVNVLNSNTDRTAFDLAPYINDVYSFCYGETEYYAPQLEKLGDYLYSTDFGSGYVYFEEMTGSELEEYIPVPLSEYDQATDAYYIRYDEDIPIGSVYIYIPKEEIEDYYGTIKGGVYHKSDEKYTSSKSVLRETGDYYVVTLYTHRFEDYSIESRDFFFVLLGKEK